MRTSQMYFQKVVKLIVCVFMNFVPNRKKLINLWNQLAIQQAVRLKAWISKMSKLTEKESAEDTETVSSGDILRENVMNGSSVKDSVLSKGKVIYFHREQSRNVVRAAVLNKISLRQLRYKCYCNKIKKSCSLPLNHRWKPLKKNKIVEYCESG